jgi:hypothetical protein
LAAWPQSLRLGVAPAPYTRRSGTCRDGFATPTPYLAWRGYPPEPSRPRPPIAHNGHARDGNLNPLSIAYGASPRLRPASPAADQHGCGTLGHSVGGIRTPLALLMPTFALPAAPPLGPPEASLLTGTLPYHVHALAHTSTASVTGLSPGGLSAPRHTRPVSYYALFQGWLLLSQPPGCFCAATTLPT